MDKEIRNKVIKDYAHDFRGIAMSSDDLFDVIKNCINEIQFQEDSKRPKEKSEFVLGLFLMLVLGWILGRVTEAIALGNIKF